VKHVGWVERQRNPSSLDAILASCRGIAPPTVRMGGIRNYAGTLSHTLRATRWVSLPLNPFYGLGFHRQAKAAAMRHVFCVLRKA
jgi:hypothetical protein